MSTAPYIPTEDDIQKVTTGGTWRFSKGEIIRGRDESVETRKSIIGILRRVGVHEGETQDEYKKPYAQLEADIETSDGLVYVKCGLLNTRSPYELKVSRSVLDFAWGLLQFQNSEDCLMITAAQGEAWTSKDGEKMSPSTYVNFWKVVNKQASRLYKPKADPAAPKVSMNDQWLALEPLIKAHPLFAERPDNRHDHDDAESGPTHLSELCKECAAKGWPTPEQAPAEWIAMAAKAAGLQAPATLSGIGEDAWGSIRQTVQPLTKLPKALEAAKARLDAAGKEENPFE